MKLIVFDIDGVLLDVKIGGFKHLAIEIGKEKEIKDLHAEYEKRKHKGPWGLEQLAALFKGISYEKLQNIARSFCENNLMKGAKETISELKSKGFSIGLFSSNPLIITNQLKQILGADFSSGNELEFKDGSCTGKLARKADRYTKAEDLRKIIEENSISKLDIFIIGDSITDIPMAKFGTFISFNSQDKEVDEIAKHVIKEKDLRKILEFIR